MTSIFLLVDSEALRPRDAKLCKGKPRAASGSCFNPSPSGTRCGSSGRADRACLRGRGPRGLRSACSRSGKPGNRGAQLGRRSRSYSVPGGFAA
ncbi:unnamed protein product [Rangifer tarandus platyrhynchus]|uniref:Uncharacterized protein n=1 Tax=Rangifer tarandus platyrhynchus TaxID=3082113 RepID=A0ABN8Z6C1_RANTA|nr:unnamed protein product [Rangifer tarandus platyrhynchus]